MPSIKESDSSIGCEAETALISFTLSQQLQSPTLRCFFLNTIFNLELDPISVQSRDDAFEAFFSRYSLLCNLAANTNRAIESITHWQFAEIVILVKDYPSDTRHKVISRIPGSQQFDWEQHGWDSHLAATVLDLAARVWSMLSIGRFSGDVSYDEPIFWEDKESLGEVIRKYLPSKSESQDMVKLPQTFTAAHLEQIGGIEVIWTSDLADHLLLKDDDTKLMLFHQVSILQLHKAPQSNLFQEGLVDETIRTISLLVPPILGEFNPWFLKQRRKHKIDVQAGNCARLNSSQRQIENFVFWRDRLVLLKRTFDDAEPRSISQLWWDDRKKTQWFTFWVAVLVFFMTVFFGVIQSVAGIVQAWASVQSLKAQNVPSKSPS